MAIAIPAVIAMIAASMINHSRSASAGHQSASVLTPATLAAASK
jgi:hypothetical protein